MRRVLSDWLGTYMKYSEDSEPPQSYHLWTGISVIASTLERKVYIKRGRSTIYPNLYIVLVGPSGRAKKGTAFEFAEPLLKAVGVKVISGAITREKLIRRMGEAITNYKAGQLIKFQCAITCVSAELSVFLGQGNIKFLSDLCEWYDCPDVWTYDTKGQGTDILEGICFNLRGATAPDWLPSILPTEAVGGGFTSRVIWIVEEDKGKTVPDPSYDETLEKLLIKDLEQIYLLAGEYRWTDEGKKRYISWYIEQDARIRDGNPPIHDPKLSGYVERRATLLHKLACVVSASEGNTMQITEVQFNRALSILEGVERKMPRVFSGLGTARYTYATEQLMAFIVRHKKVTRTQVLRFFFRDIDEYTFDIVVRTLEKAGAIKVTHVTEQREVLLELKENLYG